MSIELRNISKSFGSLAILRDINLRIPSGALVALLGPSGSGKTTLLRILAGLETPDTGLVLHEEKETTTRPARERNVGFVFQHYALFRHMSVFENIAFGLRVRRLDRRLIDKRVRELLGLVQLTGLEQRSPAQLSGGQRQRVALARALATQPQVLLLDEPFGALDAKVRQELRRWLRRLHTELHVCSVLVTHDQEEALEVADLVVVMSRGRIEQVGTPQEIFERPASAFVMDFIGKVNVFAGRVERGRVHAGDFILPYPEYPHEAPSPARVYIRPHELQIQRTPDEQTDPPATIARLYPTIAGVRVELECERWAEPLSAHLSEERANLLQLKRGESVFLSARRAHVFVEAAARGA